jgi:hypothetical protein
MKNYLAVFTGTKEARASWDKLDEATRKQREREGIAAWHKWMQDHAADLVETGAPLGKTKRTSRSGVEDISNNLSAYVTVRADSHDAAARMFENHPHFMVFPGDAVEVMECLPIPPQQ